MNDNNHDDANHDDANHDGANHDAGSRDEAGFDGGETIGGGAPQPALALDDDERLPWLESADDDEDELGAIDTGRLIRFVAFGVALLALLVGGIWYANHRGGEAQVAEGGVIPAPTEPYKSEPSDKGGKTFAGTGDSAFAVSEGKNPAAKLGGSETPVATPSAAPTPAAAAPKAAAAAPAPVAPTTGGIGVQVGAYSSQAAAEAGWSRLSSSHDALKGLKHRVLEGSADIGTVYRLQAVAADVASANALCASLKSSGVACQVKR